MSEEEKKTKISFPMFTSIEEAQLENTLNFHLDEFVNEINKTMTRDKDIIILKKVIEKQQKEIERLNSIINTDDIINKERAELIEQQQKEIDKLKKDKEILYGVIDELKGE